MHPARRGCSSLKYSRYSRSSRLASRAHRRPRCDAGLSPRAARPIRRREVMSDHSADEAAIRKHIQGHIDTLNRGDANAYAAHFAPDADTMGVGGVSKGRANIEQMVQGLLAGPFQGAKWNIQIDN